jgi:YVTN family beta-propeller protein
VKLHAPLALVTLALGTTATALAATAPNAVGPTTRIQPSGRHLTPYGRMSPLGNHPGGGALTPSGRFLWALDAGRGRNDIRIVDAAPTVACHSRGRRGARCRKRHARRTGKLIQTIPMPGVSGGIAFARGGKTAYVSGVADSSHLDEKAPPGTPGLQGDVIHVFKVSPKSGQARRAGVIPVPPPSFAPMPQDFPPTNLSPLSWPRDLAVSRNGRTLVAALNLANAAAIIDTRTRSVSYVKVGSYPYGAAITRDGRTALISNEADGTVSVIDLATKSKVDDIQVGAHLSHPEGIAIDPTSTRAFVAVAAEDKVAVIDTASRKVIRKLSVARRPGNGTQPVAVSVTRDGCRLLTSDSGEDAIAVHALRRGCDVKRARKKGKRRRAARQYSLIGRIPTASYPVFAAATPHRERIVWVAAKGLGVGPNVNGPNPLSPLDSDDHINSFQYLPSIVDGVAGSGAFPTDKELHRLSQRANAEIKPIGTEAAPAGTPLRPGGPIKHVFYIVRENRTYDQVLGDDPRGAGDPNLTLFGKDLTPNAHALAQRFPLLDHVFANSEASIDGHFWTSAGAVSDYVVKNWHQNYGGRGRPYDFVYAITWPAKRFLFDQAQAEGISYFTYGEAIAGVVPLPDRDRTQAETQQVLTKFSHSDLGEGGATVGGLQVPTAFCYPNDASIGTDAITGQEVFDSSAPATAAGALSRVDCFRQRFNTQLTTNSVPAFNYLVLTNDHTNGLAAGRRTPQAMIADNDYALGQIVDTISHSPIWDSSLILVMEDDSQDGADHVDAHRIPAFAISPYAKQNTVVSTRYDFPSLIRTLELPLGMHPLTLFDALATPLYDAFTSTPDNSAPYSAIPPHQSLTATNPNTAANRAFAKHYDLVNTDRVPQRVLDRMLWRAVKGAHSKPPPPGPNAQPGRDDDG